MGHNFSCTVHKSNYKFYCKNCMQYICDKCIGSHPCHEIRHIDTISFDVASEISKVISEMELEIHKAKQSFNFEDASSYFAKCSNSIQFLISEVNSLSTILKSLQVKVKESIQLLDKKIKINIDEQTQRKNELLDLSSHLSEITVKKNYKGLALCLSKCKDQLSLVSFKKLTEIANLQKMNLQGLLNNCVDNITKLTESISLFSKQTISTKKLYFLEVEDSIMEARNGMILNKFENSVQKIENLYYLGKCHFSPKFCLPLKEVNESLDDSVKTEKYENDFESFKRDHKITTDKMASSFYRTVSERRGILPGRVKRNIKEN